MFRRLTALAVALSTSVVVAACGDTGGVSIEAAAGPEPTPNPVEELASARAHLDSDFIDTFDPDDADCIVIGMVDGVGLSRLADLDAGSALQHGDIDAMLDSLYGCVGADALGTMFVDQMTASSDFAIPPEDRDCVVAGYGERNTLEALLGSALGAADPNAGLTAEAAEASVAPLVDCIGFGGLMKQEAEADGVTLSDPTVQCLDDDGNELFTEVVGGFLGGAAPLPGSDTQEEIVRVLLGCLSAEEMAQMDN